MATLKGYLEDLGRELHLDPNAENEILKELETHVNDVAQDLTKKGLPYDEATQRALQSLGKPKKIARQMYEVYSSASWRDTLVGMLPHLLFSLLFAFHLWSRVALVVILLLLTAAVSLKGWRHGRPNWTYPWLGYSLIAPIVSWVVAIAGVGFGTWSLIANGTLPLGMPIFLASILCIPFSLWIIVSVLRNIIRKDWLLASLAVFPFPFLAYWLLYLNSKGKVLPPESSTLKDADVSTALLFLLLAISTAIFFRIGKRLLRVALLVATTPPIIIMAWMSYQGGPGYPLIFLYSVASVLLLLTPAIFEQRISRQKQWKLLTEDRR